MNTDRPYKIIIAGGGTGGHIFPALAIGAALQQMGHVELLFVGAEGKMEMRKVPEAGYNIVGLPMAGFNRSSLFSNWKLPFLLLKSYLKVKRIFRDFPPDAVVGVGGYSSYPVMSLAQQKGIPSFLHESNSFAGRTNKMLGKKATTVFCGTEGMDPFFPAGKMVVTGNPVRAGLTENTLSPTEARNAFGLIHPGRFTILSVGGSLGAGSINMAWANLLPKLKKAGINLLWQTGSGSFARYSTLHAPEEGVVVLEFIKDMSLAYRAADLVVSRAGAMAVAELCLLQKPAVLVPYPLAAEDHQTANARLLANAGAARMIKDEALSSSLWPAIEQLSTSGNMLTDMAVRMKAFARAGADQMIARHILEHLSAN